MKRKLAYLVIVILIGIIVIMFFKLRGLKKEVVNLKEEERLAPALNELKVRLAEENLEKKDFIIDSLQQKVDSLCKP